MTEEEFCRRVAEMLTPEPEPREPKPKRRPKYMKLFPPEKRKPLPGQRSLFE